METKQIIIILGINDRREVSVEMGDALGIGWTLSQALDDLYKKFPDVHDTYDLLNMLKY